MNIIANAVTAASAIFIAGALLVSLIAAFYRLGWKRLINFGLYALGAYLIMSGGL